MNWYGRRAAVSTCCAASELYMVQDRSLDHAATMNFIARQMEKAADIESGVDGVANQAVLYASVLKGALL